MTHFKASNESGDDFGGISFSRKPRVHNGDEDEEVGKADGAKGKAHNRATLEGGEEALSRRANAANANADVGLDCGHHADVAAKHLQAFVRVEATSRAERLRRGSLRWRHPRGRRRRSPSRCWAKPSQ